MPFKSKAQERLFFSDPKLRKYAKEWAAKTDQKGLPDHVGKRKIVKGMARVGY
jgi:hypothetical protein